MAPTITAALLKHGCDMPVDTAVRAPVRWGVCDYLDQHFKVSLRGSTLWSEVRGGCVGWMTMSYIMIVHPAILHVASERSGIGLAPLVTTTALSAAFGTLLVGISTNTPFGLMPGMGLNAYFSYGVCKALGLSYQKALSCSFVGGAVLLFLCLVGACDRIVNYLLSDHLKKAITAAIGLFQAMIGFQVMGLVVDSPDTLVTMVDLTAWQVNAQVYLAIAGLLLISALLVGARMPGAMLVGVLLMAAFSWLTGLSPAPYALFDAPSFEAVFQVDFSGWWPGSPELPGLATGAFVMLFVCLFDIAGVAHGLQSAAGIPAAEQHSSSIIGAAASATIVGALLGTSPIIVANESSAAIIEGARTGLSAVVMSVLFLFSAVIAPVLCAVPRVATAVPLVIVGAFMMAPCRYICWDDLRVALPAFLTMTVVPFTYSIHGGIIAGMFVDHFLSLVTRPSRKELSSIMVHSPVCTPMESRYDSPYV